MKNKPTDYEKLQLLHHASWSLHVDGTLAMYDHHRDRWYSAVNLDDAFEIYEKLRSRGNP